MVVVVGVPGWRAGDRPGPAGRAALIALAAAARGSRVELVGRVGDDAAGDALVLALSRARVGHAATLRDPARATPIADGAPAAAEEEAAGESPHEPEAAQAPMPAPPVAPAGEVTAPGLEPADVGLGLRYLTSFRVLVLADDVPEAVLPVAIDAAGYASARLVVLLPPGRPAPEALPADATALSVPEGEDEGAFGTLVGAYAAALDGGAAPAEAFARATGDTGWEPLAAD